MFRKNDQRQQSLFGPEMLLSPGLLERLRASWAHTFRTEVFERIDETVFSVLYSEKDSRPNAPVNVLVGFEIIKAGEGWSDEALYEALSFDIRLRYALGIEDMGSEPPFTLRTLYNFRRRVREYAQEHGENLYEKVLAQVTDEQLAKYGVSTKAQRMDSTQVLSNIAQMNRLELVISVLQVGIKGLDEGEREAWEERAKGYIEKRPHEIVFGISKEENDAHFQRLGELLVALREVLAPEGEAYALVTRVLREQYREEGGAWTLRPAAEVGADSLQSPHDVEATYREKNGKRYRGGYVVQVSETCAPENKVQLITDVQVAPNVTDDGDLFQESILHQEARGLEVEEVYVDGGYTGPKVSAFCKEHGITLHPSNVRGGKPAEGRWGWEVYEWREASQEVVCPRGQVGKLELAQKEDRWLVRFPDTEQCRTCPLLSTCRVTIGKRRGAGMNVTTRNIEVALLRQRITSEARARRSPVESTVRSLKWHLRKDKLPVRGRIAAAMYFSAVAMMVNLRRIHAYLGGKSEENGAPAVFLRLIFWVWALLKPFWTPLGRSETLFANQVDNAFIFPSNFSRHPLAAPSAI